jgi:amino acid adenylation domain-containing protein
MQQGMLFHSIYAPGTGMYVEQLACTLRGDLNSDAFKQAWERVVDRHSVLRTSFVWRKVEKMLQVVHKSVELPFLRGDWRSLEGTDQARRLEEYIAEERQRGFDLRKPPLMRFGLFRYADDEYRFVWTSHHLLMDGWSTPLLMREVLQVYESLTKGEELQLEPVPRFRKYISWLEKQDMFGAEKFWRQYLQGFRSPTTIGLGRKVAPEDAGYGKELLRLDDALSSAIQECVRKHRVTLSTIVQGAWAVALSRYSGEDDVLFGVTVSGRPAELPDVERMIGLFINTLPLRVRVDPELPVIEILKRVQMDHADLRRFEYTPLVQAQSVSEVDRGSPLFESIFVFENYPVDASVQNGLSGVEVADLTSFERTNYPLTLVAASRGNVTLEIAYEKSRFDRTTVQRILEHLQTLLAQIAYHPEQPIRRLKLLSGHQEEEILSGWSRANEPVDMGGLCIHELFEKQVHRQPDAIAIVFGEERLTYGELNRRSNQLANFLKKQGVGPDKFVGLSVDRSIEMLVGILGVLKAGGAYVPIDPSYPSDRIRFMVEDSGVRFMLTQESISGEMVDASVHRICLDADWGEISRESDSYPKNGVTPRNLAYMIYTSGSTGRPKGVLIEHRGVTNLVSHLKAGWGVESGTRVLQFSSVSFDASVAEFFVGLLSGASLHITPKDVAMSPSDLHQKMSDDGINVVLLPPTMLSVLSDKDLPEMRTISSGGESCPWEVANRWAQGRKFVNAYGPTEITVASCWYSVNGKVRGATTVPIGRPTGNVKMYLVDEWMNLVPVGVPGEVYIGGVGVARGYNGRPKLTAERFIPDPYSSEAGSRVYRTGDLARYLDDGSIEYLGRLDNQVKIRGFRIELGEVEARMEEYPDVRRAVVDVREDGSGEKRLVGYFVAHNNTSPEPGELQEYLGNLLPEYMVPSAYVELQAFPLSPSGKVDRRMLPAPGREQMSRAAVYSPPRTPTEEIVAGIWASVLGVERAGVHDDFFDLGGHSLRATQAAARIRDAFTMDLPIQAVFENRTVAALAKAIDAARQEEQKRLAPPLQPVTRDGELPLSFAQQRLWFLDQLEPGSPMYNIPLALRIEGPLEVTVLEESMSEVVRRHEILRSTFRSDLGKPVLTIMPPAPFELSVIDLSGEIGDARDTRLHEMAEQESQTPFDLEKGPLLRARMIRLDHEQHVLLLTMHHIIADEWSALVLMRELGSLYEQIREGNSGSLPPLPIQYTDYAHWQREYLNESVLEQQVSYWRKQLHGAPPILEMPIDKARPSVQSFNGATVSLEIGADLRDAVADVSAQEGVTIFMTLLAGFQALLHRYTAQHDILVGSPIANRTQTATESLIGFFVNTLVLRANFHGDPTFRDIVRQSREVCLAAYAHQDVPFEKLVEELQPDRDLSHSPLFQVAFVYQSQSVTADRIGDLSLTPLGTDSATAKLDLTLMVHGKDDGFGLSLEYNCDLFTEATAHRLLRHFESLLKDAVSEPDQRVSRLQLLSDEERASMLVQWNETAAEYPDSVCVHERFEQLVQKYPDVLAVMAGAESLTYRELDRRANQLSRYLRGLGVGPEMLVGVCMERSLEMVIGVVGILKAGAGFVPLDPTYPAERLGYMIQDSGLSVLLTQEELCEELASYEVRLVPLDSSWETIAREEKTSPEVKTLPTNLAYAIYTSGSTGKPKGALLQHQGLCNLATAQIQAFGVGPASRILQFSSLSFDASVWETVMALLSGATLVMANRESLATGQGLLEVLREHHISTVTLPPSVLAVVPEEPLPELRALITAGEKCTPDLVERWGEGRNFFNAYGPTETTVCASMLRVDERYEEGPPIGRPILNTRIYLLDQSLEAVPVGVAGELHVGGIGLARGYLGRPDLTAERFMPDPFSGVEGARLYKTGDLARYLPDGNIDFMGRIDDQVKVRGFRIELGEIEAVLGLHPAIRDVVVIVREDIAGDKRIVAYVVPRSADSPASSELRSFLREQVPEFMVPSTFVFLDEMPLMPNGKIDKRALPVPERSRDDLENVYVGPRNDAEDRLTELSAKLLGMEKVGVHDDFFELGGHSLLATQLISRVRQEFDVEIPLRAIFAAPTVAGLAEKIEALKKESQGSLEVISEKLKNIENLSQSEVEALLGERQGRVSG